MSRKEVIAFVVLLILSLLPNALVMCLAADVATAGQRLGYALTTLALYGFGLMLFHRRAYLYIVSLGFLFSAYELLHVVLRGTTTTMLCLYVLLKTPPELLWQMVSPHIGWLIGGVAVWVLYYVAAHYLVAREWIGSWRWRLPVAAVCLALFMLSPVSVCPTHVMSQLSRLGAMAIHIEKTQPEQRAFTYGIQPNDSKADETVMVVLGETTYEQWQALGYRDSLAIAFDSVYAGSPVCGVAMPMLLTRATAQNKGPFFTERSLIRAFDEAGFYTAWLSNYGYHDHLLMRIADNCRYLTYQPGVADTVLLEGFREAMLQPAQRHLVVMTTQGGRNLQTFGDTPYLLRQLTDSLRVTHMPAMLIYAGLPNISLSNGHQELRMPLIVWANPNYRYRHRPLIRCLNEQRTARVTADYLFHTLLYMNDIACPQRDDERALGNKQMVPADTIRYLDENLHTRVWVP
jgi:glucan phosphoethanolaminetransferase (alkaline phosphatase superfamily)